MEQDIEQNPDVERDKKKEDMAPARCPIAPGDDKMCCNELCTFERICPHSTRHKNLEKIMYRCPYCKTSVVRANGYVDVRPGTITVSLPVHIKIWFQCDECDKEFIVHYNIDQVEEVEDNNVSRS